MFGGYEGGDFREDPIEVHRRQQRKLHETLPMSNPNPIRHQWSDHEVETLASIHDLTLGPELKKDDKWYIKLPGGPTVVEIKITDVTDKTVEFKLVHSYSTPARYIKTDTQFVEKVR